MLSLMLRDADYDPTLLIGGNLEELDGNVRIGKGDYFVTELDSSGKLLDEICKFMPSELICNEACFISGRDIDELRERR